MEKIPSRSFLQTPFWGEFKARHGWHLLRVDTKNLDTDEHGYTQIALRADTDKSDGVVPPEVSVLVRSFAKGLFSLAYIPLYPAFEPAVAAPCRSIEMTSPTVNGGFDKLNHRAVSGEDFAKSLKDLAVLLKPLLPKNTICIRFDPALDFYAPTDRDAFLKNARASLKKSGIKKTRVDIQPPDTTQVDLTKSEEEILAAMKSKWRYNINLAKKKGVQIEKWPDASLETEKNILGLEKRLDVFYDLYKITAERDGIAMHAKTYYEDLLKSSLQENEAGNDAPKVSLYIARHEDDFLGAIITLFTKNEAVYLYGCSSNVKRNLMPNFLLQWTAMQDAKAYGSLYYDMYGMPPTDDENHPMHGLYLFKTGFGGKNIHRPGTFDIPLKAIYGLAIFAENARAFWHKKILKKIRGR